MGNSGVPFALAMQIMRSKEDARGFPGFGDEGGRKRHRLCFSDMRSRLLLAFASSSMLAACGDDASSDNPVLQGFEGTWEHYEDSTDLRDRIHFVGGHLRHEAYHRGCRTGLTIGDWAYAEPYLSIEPTLSWNRAHDENARDSAGACIQEPDTAQLPGSYRVELANVGASSFEVLTRKSVLEDGVPRDTIIRELYRRQ